MKSLQEKWDGHYQRHQGKRPSVAEVLLNNHYLLPKQGVALDFACGLGGNALMLAENGLDVKAWDISPVAIAKLNQIAAERGLSIQAEVRDVLVEPPEKNSIDVLLVSLFLAREICPLLWAALYTSRIY
jgi:2-polyprenyl-3-methyl-5-hydroxy-6-metoxy-1,4-benzoquinol methylase